jgi:3-keto-disaccharide hydrolase
MASRASNGWLAFAVALMVASWAAGCKKTAPCRPGTVLLTIDFDATTEQADEVAIAVQIDTGAIKQSSVVKRPAGAASMDVEIDFSDYPRGKSVSVIVTALQKNGMQLGSTGTVTQTVSAACESWTVSFEPADGSALGDSGRDGTGGASGGTGGTTGGTGGTTIGGTGGGATMGGSTGGTGGATTGGRGGVATGGSTRETTGGTGGGAMGGAGGIRSGGGGTTTAGAGGAAATGCNWIHDAVMDIWAFNPAPADKIILFDGTTTAGWHQLSMPGNPIIWKLVTGGAMEIVTPSGATQATEIQSDMKFDDVCVHVEYMTPIWTPSNPPDVYNQGDSGVYLKSAYEMQILDTSKLGPLDYGCGAVNGIAAPLVVACTQYLTWNTYEIEFETSVWNSAGVKTKNAVIVRVALNGKIVQLNVDLNTTNTQAGIPDAPGPQPLGLRDHLQPVQFRNIWATIPKY